MDKLIDKIYNEHFRGYYKREFDIDDEFNDTEIYFKDEVKSVLETAYKDFKLLLDSKIDLKHYEREIDRLNRNAKELQKYSTEKIKLDLLPKIPDEILFEMRSYLSTTYKLKKEVIEEAFREMQNDILNIKRVRNPKKTNKAKKNEEFLISLLTNMSEDNKGWEEHCNNNKGMSLKQLRDTFKQ